MSATLDVLGPEGLSKDLPEMQSWFDETKPKLERVDRLKKLWLTSKDHYYRNGHSERSTLLDVACNLARILHGSGKPPADVRAVLRKGAEAYAPILGILDYSVSEQEFSVAKSLASRYEGKTLNTVSGRIFWPADAHLGAGFKTIKVTVRNQPDQDDPEKALIAALMAWDFDLAERMARSYQLQPAVAGDEPNSYGLLRQAVLGNHDNALVFLKAWPKGYDPDFPPKQRELAEGVIRKDCALIKAGLKSLSKRFQTAWTLKTYATPARLRRAGTIEKMLPDIRRQLVGHNWLLSDWGVAWMSLAWRRGLKKAFSEPGLFSEWIPWELCCPKPSPAPAASARPGAARPVKLGVRALKAALFKAIESDDGEAITGLLAQGADLEAKDDSKRTPLLAASAAGKPAALAAILRGKPDRRAEEGQGRNALSLAAENGNAEAVRLLLEAGFRPDVGNSPATALPLLYAARGGHAAAAALLVTAGADVSCTDWNKSFTFSTGYKLGAPISYAARSGSVELVDLLIKAGADVNQITRAREPAITCAAQGKSLEVLKRLIEAGADIEARQQTGTTALNFTARQGWAEGTALQLKAGADVHARDDYEETALHGAAEWGSPEVIQLLLKAGARIDVRNNQGKTPAKLAANFPDRLAVLVKAGHRSHSQRS